ncbi:winged helix-turn-helix transcriptional regulator [Mycobacterium sp. pV006]|uniref:winged helix-turn-helix transcriptional regulator n=1 Tax=Mycobacterium sp. pV006 TaxID=3238983 RepID=UPI00351BA660
MTPTAAEPNAVARMLGLLGDEWTLLIVQRALLGAARYGDFAAALPVSHAVLTDRLRSMTSASLLEPRPYQSRPRRVEYLLTAQGRSLWPMLTSIWHWERRWVSRPLPRLPAMIHRPCGATHACPRVVCRSCGAPTDGEDVVAQWGPSGSWERSIPAGSNRRRSTGRRNATGSLFPETMSVIGDRWAFALLVAAFVGFTRFGEFQAQLGAPPGTVADRLALFCDQGVIANVDGRYLLTDKGRGFFPVLVCALDWAQRWFPTPEGPAVVLTHRGCGGVFRPVLVCDQCNHRLSAVHIAPAE